MLWALPMAHAVSRVTPVWFMASAKYVRDEAGAKSKPMGHKVNVGTVVWVTLWALAGIALAFVLLHSLIVAAVLTGLVLSGFVVVRRLAMRKIGGFTGDILGAMQQVTEVLLYVGLAACLQS
jgi:adenosylcobinamide-GDP ribazoletransferase